MPKGSGVIEGAILECVLHDIDVGQHQAKIDRSFAKPADGRGGRSANLPMVLAAAGAVQRHPAPDLWWQDEAVRRLAGPLFANEDGTGQYTGFTVAATAVAAWATALPKVGRLLRAQLALCAACAVPWEAEPDDRWSDHLTVLSVGERVQEHHYGPITMMLADACGFPVHSRWRRRLTREEAEGSLSGRAPQGRIWPWRCWSETPVWVRQNEGSTLRDIVDGKVSKDTVELLSSVRLRAPVTVERYENALVVCWRKWWNPNSTACGGVIAVRGQAPKFLVVDKDPDGPGPMRLRGKLKSGWARMEVVDGALTLIGENNAGTRASISADTSGFGPWLCSIDWPGDNVAPIISSQLGLHS